jgi:hypothetical protein
MFIPLICCPPAVDGNTVSYLKVVDTAVFRACVASPSPAPAQKVDGVAA